ncbi:hypothetical protein [Glycomyces sp. NPDC048151]|uniref:hypothetical protein n=1 Tax=Glycomyces sp. NPDC048151 TaxID=3364002 RepID=UPI00370FA79B
MGVGRRAPQRVRARYAKALAEIPLAITSFSGIDPGGLVTIGEAEIDGRELHFGLLYAIPRLWISFPDRLPPVLGFVTGLDSGTTDLHITDLDHLEWARQAGRAARIKREAVTVWQAAQRECEG